MDDLQALSQQAADCLKEAIGLRAQVADAISAEIGGADNDERQALLEIRILAEAASGDLSVAWQRMTVLADRVSALSKGSLR